MIEETRMLEPAMRGFIGGPHLSPPRSRHREVGLCKIFISLPVTWTVIDIGAESLVWLLCPRSLY